MEKMKQECKVKKPLKIWQGVLTLLVSAVILFVAAPILLSPFQARMNFPRGLNLPASILAAFSPLSRDLGFPVRR